MHFDANQNKSMANNESAEIWRGFPAESTATDPDWVNPLVEEVFGQLDDGSKHEFGDMDKV